MAEEEGRDKEGWDEEVARLTLVSSIASVRPAFQGMAGPPMASMATTPASVQRLRSRSSASRNSSRLPQSKLTQRRRSKGASP
jgi:hypothetical protein